MDFKIGDDIVDENEEETKLKKESNGKMTIIIIVVFALIVGLLVFFIANGIFNPSTKKKKVEPVTSQKRSLNEENVKTLYKYVTYGTNGIRNDKFVKNEKVSLDDFSDDEKYYYALQLAQVEDFVYTGNLDSNNRKIYSISERVVKKYMERFFGKNIKYSNDFVITHPFSFSINYQNIGIMKYNSDTASYDTIFDGASVDEEFIVEPYIGKLMEAYKDPDGSYRLIEKVIYVQAEKNDNNTYDISVYSDYEHTNELDKLTNQSEDDIKKFSITKYIDKAATITYTFQLNGNVLYFYSSSIK